MSSGRLRATTCTGLLSKPPSDERDASSSSFPLPFRCQPWPLALPSAATSPSLNDGPSIKSPESISPAWPCGRLRLCVLCRLRAAIVEDKTPCAFFCWFFSSTGDRDRDGLWLRLWFSGRKSTTPKTRLFWTSSAPAAPVVVASRWRRTARGEAARDADKGTRLLIQLGERRRPRPRSVLDSMC